MNVSVIIPAINEESRIRRAVRSAWRAGAAEVIVVDGGSTDDTVIVAQRSKATVLSSPLGRAAQQNLGARYARNEVLLFLHADTWLSPGCLAQVDAVLANPHCHCGAFRQRIDQAGFLYRALEWGNALRVRSRGMAYGDQAIFVKRQLFLDLDGFPDQCFLEDVLLLQRIRRRTWPALLDGPLHVSARRWRKRGVLKQTLLNWRILTLHRLGVSPERLVRLYRRHDANG